MSADYKEVKFTPIQRVAMRHIARQMTVAQFCAGMDGNKNHLSAAIDWMRKLVCEYPLPTIVFAVDRNSFNSHAWAAMNIIIFALREVPDLKPATQKSLRFKLNKICEGLKIDVISRLGTVLA